MYRWVRMRDGAQLYVREWGCGEPVLVLSGLGMLSMHWWPFLRRWFKRYTFIIPEFRGAGHSAQVSLQYLDVFQGHTEDVEDIVEAMQLKDVLLIGYSLGASVAWHWQRNGGFDHVQRYLNIDQSPCIPNRPDWSYGLMGDQQDEFFKGLNGIDQVLQAYCGVDTLAHLPLSARWELLGAWSQLARQSFHSSMGARILSAAVQFPMLLQGWFPLQRLADMRAYLYSYLHAHDYRSSMQSCRIPVTFFVGQKSIFYPAIGQQLMQSRLSVSTVVQFARSGHLLPLQEPQRFVQELGRFLT